MYTTTKTSTNVEALQRAYISINSAEYENGTTYSVCMFIPTRLVDKVEREVKSQGWAASIQLKEYERALTPVYINHIKTRRLAEMKASHMTSFLEEFVFVVMHEGRHKERNGAISSQGGVVDSAGALGKPLSISRESAMSQLPKSVVDFGRSGPTVGDFLEESLAQEIRTTLYGVEVIKTPGGSLLDIRGTDLIVLKKDRAFLIQVKASFIEALMFHTRNSSVGVVWTDGSPSNNREIAKWLAECMEVTSMQPANHKERPKLKVPASTKSATSRPKLALQAKAS